MKLQRFAVSFLLSRAKSVRLLGDEKRENKRFALGFPTSRDSERTERRGRMGDKQKHEPQIAREWLESLSRGETHELEALSLAGLQVEHAERGLIRCKFIVPNHLSDGVGNWCTGAMALLIDDVGAAAICSAVGHIKVSVNFSVSFISTAKIQEEVDIEAKVTEHKGKLTLVVVEVKKEGSGEMVAFAKQWMASVSPEITNQPSKL
ncbi:Acyl-CoA hydrolase [Bertholletia excelsa]